MFAAVQQQKHETITGELQAFFFAGAFFAFLAGSVVAFFPFLVAVVGGTGLEAGMLDMMNVGSGNGLACSSLVLS